MGNEGKATVERFRYDDSTGEIRFQALLRHHQMTRVRGKQKTAYDATSRMEGAFNPDRPQKARDAILTTDLPREVMAATDMPRLSVRMKDILRALEL